MTRVRPETKNRNYVHGSIPTIGNWPDELRMPPRRTRRPAVKEECDDPALPPPLRDLPPLEQMMARVAAAAPVTLEGVLATMTTEQAPAAPRAIVALWDED